MKIGVYGSAAGTIEKNVAAMARRGGKTIAVQGHVLITGACPGLPYEAVCGAHEMGGTVIGYSPATDLRSHKEIYRYPVEGFTEFVFVPQKYPHRDDPAVCKKYRNVSSVAASDAALFVGGRTGTMNEFIIAYDLGKIIGVLRGSGGITERAIEVLLEDIDKRTDASILWGNDPVELVKKIKREKKKKS
jgi:hypothetical protein